MVGHFIRLQPQDLAVSYKRLVADGRSSLLEDIKVIKIKKWTDNEKKA